MGCPGTQPLAPTTACYETATFNDVTCAWDVTGTQPEQPSTQCYEALLFDQEECSWNIVVIDALIPGSICDDGDACTVNDITQFDCSCAGTFEDTDSDGICNSLEVLGCQDALACDYNSLATDSSACNYPSASYLDCNNVCVNDADVDGVCDEIEIVGCQDTIACNYEVLATDSGTCTYPIANYLDCDGVCINDTDLAMVCQ